MKTLIIGVGLIGGSFALALKDNGLSDEVIGSDRSAEHLEQALRAGIVDRTAPWEEALPGADLIVLAIPVDAIPLLAVKILNRIGERQTVIDLGSTKGELCEAIAQHRKRERFVATHPMWGTEFSGPGAALHGAFRGCKAVICNAAESAPNAVARIEALYRNLGMECLRMDADEHDLHAAYVSHISHVSSFALALTVLEKERESKHIFDLAGGGFESTVRLAGSSAATWIPILLKNKYNVLDVLREHIHQLNILRTMIERDDADALRSAIERANEVKKNLGK